MIALFLAAGVAGWIYSKIMKRTGGNMQQSVTTAGIAGFLAFLIMFSVMIMIS